FQGLTADASLMPVFSAWGDMMDEQTDAELARAADKRADEAAERAHAPKPVHAWRPVPASWGPAALYNGMVAPAIGFGIKAPFGIKESRMRAQSERRFTTKCLAP